MAHSTLEMRKMRHGDAVLLAPITSQHTEGQSFNTDLLAVYPWILMFVPCPSKYSVFPLALFTEYILAFDFL